MSLSSILKVTFVEDKCHSITTNAIRARVILSECLGTVQRWPKVFRLLSEFRRCRHHRRRRRVAADLKTKSKLNASQQIPPNLPNRPFSVSLGRLK
jgi:hypothetical protein